MESGGDAFISNEWFSLNPSRMMSFIQETTTLSSTILPKLVKPRPTMQSLPSCGSFREGQAIYCPPGWTFGWYKLNVTYCCYPQDYVAPELTTTF